MSLQKIGEGQFSSGAREGEIILWKKMDSKNWRKMKEFRNHDKGVLGMVTIESNATLVSCSEDRKLHLVNIKTGQLECSETVDRTYVISLARYC